MPLYKYKAINSAGKEEKGVINAYSVDDLEVILRQRGLILMSYTEGSEQSRGFLRGKSKRKKMKEEDIIDFLNSLGNLLDAGVDVVRALEIQSEHARKDIKPVIERMIDVIRNGDSFTDAMLSTEVFPSHVVEPIRVGEEAGRLSEVLFMLAERLKKGREFKAKIKKASIYPSFVVSFIFVLVLLVFKVVIPKVIKSIKEIIVGDYPPITAKVVAFADFMEKFMSFFIPFSVVSLIVFIVAYKTSRGRYVIDKLKLKIPHMRDILLFGDIIKLLQVFAVSIKTGFSYQHALEMGEKNMANTVLKEKVSNIRSMLSLGNTLADSIKANELHYYLTIVVSTGEFSGRLDELVDKAIEYYVDATNEKIDKFFSWLEPIIIIFLGLVVLTVLLCALVPMWESMTYITK